MIPKIIKSALILTTLTTLIACSELKNGECTMPPIDHISATEWQSLKQMRIVFGHQSVGYNILSGVETLAHGAGVSFKIVESRNAPSEFGIAHFRIGKNGDPQLKIKDFAAMLEGGSVQGMDVALMKLCYVDINANTDIRKLADEYSTTLDRLSKHFPKTTFIGVTAPLTTVQSGFKAWLKGLMGKAPGGYVENFRRQQFNTIMRSRYGHQGRLFDLAKFEAEGAGSYQYKGQPIETLNLIMSDDGGHLNSQGQQYVASKLLKLLASASR